MDSSKDVKEALEYWSRFSPLIFSLLNERNVSLRDIFQFVWKISNNRLIFLLVDEIGKANYQNLVPSLHELRQSFSDNFLPFYSALNPDYLKVSGSVISSYSDRAIIFVPLSRRKSQHVWTLFLNLFTRHMLPENDKRLLKRCVSFCNGHMRSLKALYEYIESLPTLKDLEFTKIADGTIQQLRTLQTKLPPLDAEDAKICILGKEVESTAKTHSSKMLTYRQAVAGSYFFNREDDLDAPRFVPKLTPFALYWVCACSYVFHLLIDFFFQYYG